MIHLHADAGVAVSAQKDGLLPLTQHSLLVLPTLAYHDYEGVALNLDERERLVADLGDKPLMLLRNHGTLSLGARPPRHGTGSIYLEKACRQQVMALSARPRRRAAGAGGGQAEAREQSAGMPFVAGLTWPGSCGSWTGSRPV